MSDYDEHVARIVDEMLFFGSPPRWWVKSLWLGPLRLTLTHQRGWWLPRLSVRIVR